MKKKLHLWAICNAFFLFVVMNGYSQELSGDLSYWEPLTSGIPENYTAGTFILSLQEECPAEIEAIWKLDETSGPTYYDYVGGHNITLQSGAASTPGIVGGAQVFNTDTRMTVEDNGFDFEWQTSDNFSFEYWMKTTSGATMVAIGRYRSNISYLTWWVGTVEGVATFYLRDNTEISTQNPDGKYFEITGGPEIMDNQWHHVVAVREGSMQENRLYVDGVEVASVTTDYSYSFAANDPIPITIGWFNVSGSTGYHFTGSLDEVAIFNKALSDEEVTEYYNNGNPDGHCAGTATNHVPVITSTPALTVNEDEEYAYTFTITDADAGDVITLTAPTIPEWLTFTFTAGQKTAEIRGTPTNDNLGDNDIILQAFDGHVNVTQPFTLNVINVNDAPEFTSAPVTSARVNSPYSYTVSAEDVDSETITFSAPNKPDWLTFDPATKVLSGTPKNEDLGNNDITIRATDGSIDVDQNFTIVVGAASAVSDLQEAGIKIYPVPATTYLDIDLGKDRDYVILQIVNSSGSVLISEVVRQLHGVYRMDMGDIINGQYYIRIKSIDLDVTGSFIKTK